MSGFSLKSARFLGRRSRVRPGRWAAPLLAVPALFAVGVSGSLGQQPPQQTPSASEYTIKAAYVYNFLKYIEWPSSAFEDDSSPFVIGTVGNVPADLEKALAHYEESKTVRGRAIRVRNFKTAEAITDCHLVFLTRTLDRETLSETIERFTEDPTLLVGETTGFLEQGGEIVFFVDSRKIHIRLALEETRRKGLKPSAKLLQVAQLAQ